MSNEFKDRYISITLLKTLPRYYSQYREHLESKYRTEQEGGKLIRYYKGSPKYVVDRLLKLP